MSGCKKLTLMWKSRKNYIFKIDFYTSYKNQKQKLKPYLECSFHVNFKNGLSIKFSCRNDGEKWELR